MVETIELPFFASNLPVAVSDIAISDRKWEIGTSPYCEKRTEVETHTGLQNCFEGAGRVPSPANHYVIDQAGAPGEKAAVYVVRSLYVAANP